MRPQDQKVTTRRGGFSKGGLAQPGEPRLARGDEAVTSHTRKRSQLLARIANVFVACCHMAKVPVPGIARDGSAPLQRPERLQHRGAVRPQSRARAAGEKARLREFDQLLLTPHKDARLLCRCSGTVTTDLGRSLLNTTQLSLSKPPACLILNIGYRKQPRHVVSDQDLRHSDADI